VSRDNCLIRQNSQNLLCFFFVSTILKYYTEWSVYLQPPVSQLIEQEAVDLLVKTSISSVWRCQSFSVTVLLTNVIWQFLFGSTRVHQTDRTRSNLSGSDPKTSTKQVKFDVERKKNKIRVNQSSQRPRGDRPSEIPLHYSFPVHLDSPE